MSSNLQPPASQQLESTSFPGFQMPVGSPPDLLRITRMRDALEILRSELFVMEPVGAEAPLRRGTLLKLDGELHRSRRRAVNRLVRRESHQRYRAAILLPAVERRIADLMASPDSDGSVRADLVGFSRSLFIELAAAFVGIQGVGTVETYAALSELVEPMHKGSILRWFPDQETVLADAMSALEVFREKYFIPSLRARRELVAAQSGVGGATPELPNDLMTLVALKTDPAWEDESLALRTVVFYMAGASNTHVRPLGHIVDELESWFVIHPADLGLRTDPGFLAGAISEALRLYGNTPALFRIATQDTVLPSGISVRSGQHLAIDTRLTGRDAETYGPDAGVFNPRRQVDPDTYAFGMAFGSGNHMCQGLPLVLGVEGIDGNLMHVLRALYGAGMRRDESRSSHKVPVRDSYELYPVIFDRAPMGLGQDKGDA
jgi:cytochrome P450